MAWFAKEEIAKIEFRDLETLRLMESNVEILFKNLSENKCDSLKPQ